jgi:hypothetical protein
MRHELKTWPELFEPVRRGTKKADFRKDDRDFQVRDELLMREWNPETREYTGRSILVEVTHVLRTGHGIGVPEGYVVMSFTQLHEMKDIAVDRRADEEN